MVVVFWTALGFLVASALAGSAFVGVRGWRAWQAFTSFAAGMGGGVDKLLAAADQLAAHGERTAARAEELVGAVERLRRAQAHLGVLLAAGGEVRDLGRALRAFVPQK